MLFDTVVGADTESCVGVMRACVLQVFSQLGGLQLDRDIRSLVSAAGELTSKPVRDKFARLTQVWVGASTVKLSAAEPACQHCSKWCRGTQGAAVASSSVGLGRALPMTAVYAELPSSAASTNLSSCELC